MGLFKKKVQDTVTDAVGMVKDLATKATAEKMDIWGDAAKIGTFAIMVIGVFRGMNKGGSSPKNRDVPDVRTMTINNYYYGYRPQNMHGRKKNDRVS